MYHDYIARKLRDHASAQCRIRLFDNGDIVFQSYSTDVIYYRKSTNTLYCTGTYSATTRKQMGWFLREYFPGVGYYDMRECYEKDRCYCVSTRLMRDLTPAELSLSRDFREGCTLYPTDFERIGVTEAL